MVPDKVLAAWRRTIPDVTYAEVSALIAIMGRHPDAMRRMVHAYRAGQKARRDTAPERTECSCGHTVDDHGAGGCLRCRCLASRRHPR